MSHSAIQSATLSWNEQGTPVSQQFDDVYFSNQNGLLETRYVFLQGNRLESRWKTWQKSVFIVAETGFGTGLNFLALWQAFIDFRRENPDSVLKRLHFISFEKFPLRVDDLTAAHQHWPELAAFSAELRARWPMLLPGCHRVLLAEEHITLDLWFGDVNECIPALPAALHGKIDAWFLDGFAPAKNPDMWTDALFRAMASLAAPGGTFATFTAAGFVRRGLQQAGFLVERIKGFGHKREMLAGVKQYDEAHPDPAPWFSRPAAGNPHDVAVIGGGIAGALAALALLRRGARVTLYYADDEPGQGASGNRQGALYPLLNGKNDALEHFFAAAFSFARRHYDQLAQEGCAFDHQWCGVTQLGWDEKSTQKLHSITTGDWPETLCFPADAQTLEPLCGLPVFHDGVCYPDGGWLCPAQLTRAAVTLAQRNGAVVYPATRIRALQRRDECWLLETESGGRHAAPCVVLANGHEITGFDVTAPLPLYAVRGQVSHIPDTPALSRLRQVLCYDGYLTPVNPATGLHCIGASYQRNQTDTAYRRSDQEENRTRLLNCLPEAAWAQEVDISADQARAGVRCAVRDHLPMVGAVPDYAATLTHYAQLKKLSREPQNVAPAPVYPDLFMIGGLGSRGLCSAPLCAEVLAAQICGEPLPLAQPVLDALNPNRMWVRKLLKGKPA